ncbi:MAG: transcription antitermination factor NusB [Erysipelotrichaceae bacterium]|nr:transcription antitermination factor NusB [Erysipelotrichaceae bacterium]
MNRHEYRIKVVEIVYQHLLLKKTFNELARINLKDIPVDDYFKKIINYCRRNIDNMIIEISPLLNKWEFDRLNFVSQAILLVACSEIKLAVEDKAVIIDEAIEIAKTYSDEDDYKFINGVLDSYVK